MNMTDMFWVATQLCWWVTRAATSSAIAMTWKLYCTQKFARLGPIIPFVAAGIFVVFAVVLYGYTKGPLPQSSRRSRGANND